MARSTITLLLLLISYGSSMEMRETVERMVMVRKTGSDLQPEATGYIYKKESDGPASVIELGESEVAEQLSKMYEQPKSFAAPLPIAAGPFYAKEKEVLPNSSETKVIPVVENQEDDIKPIDGIADEDYEKALAGYAGNYGDYKSDFDAYLKSLEDGSSNVHGSKDQDSLGGTGFKEPENEHKFEKSDAGDYHTEKYESYQITEKGGDKKSFGDGNIYGKFYADKHGYHGPNEGFKFDHTEHVPERFRKLYEKDEYKKGNEGNHFYNEEAIKDDFDKYEDGHNYYRSDAIPAEEGDFVKSANDYIGFGEGIIAGKTSENEDDDGGHLSERAGVSSQHYTRDFGFKGPEIHSESYGFEIKH